jgi:hypothetical protein
MRVKYIGNGLIEFTLPFGMRFMCFLDGAKAIQLELTKAIQECETYNECT